MSESKMNPLLDEKYTGRTVHHEDNAMVVTISVNFYRRNGRQKVDVRPENETVSEKSEQDINKTPAAAIAKA